MQFGQLRRRDVITLVGGAMAAWPLEAGAQQPTMPVVGFLSGSSSPERAPLLVAFRQGLTDAGFVEGRNVAVEYRWSADGDKLAALATEMVAHRVAVIVSVSAVATAHAIKASAGTIPIVFEIGPDPLKLGFVASLGHPGGNVTGFMAFEYGMSGKWLELLKEIAPRVTRAAIIRDPTVPVGIGQLGAIQSVAPSFGVEASPINVRDTGEVERDVTAFARSPNGGLIVTASALAVVHRELIVTLAARHRLPAVYFDRMFVNAGGLISYGLGADPYRQAAGYVDRIFKGENPGELPVQAPVKFELAINLKTAKAIGLDVPPTLLARADEVIE